jgi:hypothetical protein
LASVAPTLATSSAHRLGVDGSVGLSQGGELGLGGPHLAGRLADPRAHDFGVDALADDRLELAESPAAILQQTVGGRGPGLGRRRRRRSPGHRPDGPLRVPRVGEQALEQRHQGGHHAILTPVGDLGWPAQSGRWAASGLSLHLTYALPRWKAPSMECPHMAHVTIPRRANG